MVHREARLNPLQRAFYRAVGLIGTAPLFAPLHTSLFRILGGRFVGRLLDTDIVLLTTHGRRTGRSRTTPLLGVRDGDRLLIVASNAGRDRSPEWYLNLRADTDVLVQMGSGRRRMRARVARGPELQPLWDRATHAYPGYAVYREISKREIPLVILEPRDTGEAPSVTLKT